jgi:hypothetical protein
MTTLTTPRAPGAIRSILYLRQPRSARARRRAYGWLPALFAALAQPLFAATFTINDTAAGGDVAEQISPDGTVSLMLAAQDLAQASQLEISLTPFHRPSGALLVMGFDTGSSSDGESPSTVTLPGAPRQFVRVDASALLSGEEVFGTLLVSENGGDPTSFLAQPPVRYAAAARTADPVDVRFDRFRAASARAPRLSPNRCPT